MYAGSHTHMSLMQMGKSEALAHGMLDLLEPDNSFEARFRGRSKRITLSNGTPALIYVGNCFKDEWVFSITLWPTPDAEEYMSERFANERAGEVFASGWLNRWQYDGRAIGIERFHDNRAYVAPARKVALAELLSADAIAE